MNDSKVDQNFFAHPRVDNNTEVIDAMVKSMHPHVVLAAIAPNFAVDQPSASPTLYRAFSVDHLFAHRAPVSNSAAAPNGDVAFKWKNDDGKQALGKPLPSGYAVKVDGSMPIDSKERLDHMLGAWNQGLGTSMYPVQGALPAGLSHNASDDQIAKLNEQARESLPHLISPTHRVSLERTTNTFDGDQFAVFVTANDVPAARRLYQYTAARAVSENPLNVDTLVSSEAYNVLHERAQCARDTLAQSYASALGLKVAAQPDLTSLHYTILPSNALAHGHHDSPVQQQAAREAHFFVAYNNATPTHLENKGVIVSHGIMGGHTILNADNNEPWQQPLFLSLMPATSVQAHDGHTQLEAVNRVQTERSRAAFGARVVWHSDLGDEFQHAAANETFNSMQDPFSHKWLERLSPPHTGPLEQRPYSMIAGQLPSVSTLYATPEELGAIARLDQTPPNVKVALDNPIVAQIGHKWDTVIRPSGYALHIGDVFANAYEDSDEEKGGFRLLTRHTMCTNHSHAHATDSKTLYPDADQYLPSQSSPAGVSRSSIMLDKKLLQLLTK